MSFAIYWALKPHYLSIYLWVWKFMLSSLSISGCICLSVCLNWVFNSSVYCLSVCVCGCLFVCVLSERCNCKCVLFICLSVCVWFCLSVCMYVCVAWVWKYVLFIYPCVFVCGSPWLVVVVGRSGTAYLPNFVWCLCVCLSACLISVPESHCVFEVFSFTITDKQSLWFSPCSRLCFRWSFITNITCCLMNFFGTVAVFASCWQG